MSQGSLVVINKDDSLIRLNSSSKLSQNLEESSLIKSCSKKLNSLSIKRWPEPSIHTLNNARERLRARLKFKDLAFTLRKSEVVGKDIKRSSHLLNSESMVSEPKSLERQIGDRSVLKLDGVSSWNNNDVVNHDLSDLPKLADRSLDEQPEYMIVSNE